jgi:hypothetical protein
MHNLRRWLSSQAAAAAAAASPLLEFSFTVLLYTHLSFWMHIAGARFTCCRLSLLGISPNALLQIPLSRWPNVHVQFVTLLLLLLQARCSASPAMCCCARL